MIIEALGELKMCFGRELSTEILLLMWLFVFGWARLGTSKLRGPLSEHRAHNE